MHLRGACCLFRVTSSCFHPSLSCLPEGEALRPARSQPRQPARTRGSAARLPPSLPPSAPTPPLSVCLSRAGGRRCGPRCRTVAVHCGGRGNRCRRSRCDRSVASAAAAARGKLGPHSCVPRGVCCAQVWFKTMPNVTKFYMTFSFLTALLCAFDVLSPLQLYLNADLILRNMEVRLLPRFPAGGRSCCSSNGPPLVRCPRFGGWRAT